MGLFTIHGNHYEYSDLFPVPDATMGLPNTTPPTRYLLIQTAPDKLLSKEQYEELHRLGFKVLENLGRDVYPLYWPPTSASDPPPTALNPQTTTALKDAGIPRVAFYPTSIDPVGSPKVESIEGVEEEFEGLEFEDQYKEKFGSGAQPEVAREHVRRDNSIGICVSLHSQRDRSTTAIITDLKLKLTRLAQSNSSLSQYQPISDALDSIARTNASAAPIEGISNDLILVTVNRGLLKEWPVELLREWGTIDEVCAISEVHPPRPCWG